MRRRQFHLRVRRRRLRVTFSWRGKMKEIIGRWDIIWGFIRSSDDLKYYNQEWFGVSLCQIISAFHVNEIFLSKSSRLMKISQKLSYNHMLTAPAAPQQFQLELRTWYHVSVSFNFWVKFFGAFFFWRQKQREISGDKLN